MDKLISQLCGDSQSAVCLPRVDGAIWRPPEHSWTSDKLEEEAWVKVDWAVLNTHAVSPLMWLTNSDEKYVLKLCVYKTPFIWSHILRLVRQLAISYRSGSQLAEANHRSIIFQPLCMATSDIAIWGQFDTSKTSQWNVTWVLATVKHSHLCVPCSPIDAKQKKLPTKVQQ